MDAHSEARCKAIAFSAPVWVSQDGMYTLPGNPKKITGYKAVAANPELKLAAITGSAQEAYALKVGVKPEQIVRVPDIQAGGATVIGGRANVFAVGQYSLKEPQEKGLEVAVDRESPVNAYAVAFRKEDVKFRDAFNRQIDALKTSGTVKEISERHGIRNSDLLAKYHRPSDAVPGCE